MEAGVACRQCTGWSELALQVLGWGPGELWGAEIRVEVSWEWEAHSPGLLPQADKLSERNQNRSLSG